MYDIRGYLWDARLSGQRGSCPSSLGKGRLHPLVWRQAGQGSRPRILYDATLASEFALFVSDTPWSAHTRMMGRELGTQAVIALQL